MCLNMNTHTNLGVIKNGQDHIVLVRGRISRTNFIVLVDQTEETKGVLGTVLEVRSCFQK